MVGFWCGVVWLVLLFQNGTSCLSPTEEVVSMFDKGRVECVEKIGGSLICFLKEKKRHSVRSWGLVGCRGVDGCRNLTVCDCGPLEYRTWGDGGCRRCLWWHQEHGLSEGITLVLEVYCLFTLKVEGRGPLNSSWLGVFVGCKDVLSPGCREEGLPVRLLGLSNGLKVDVPLLLEGLPLLRASSSLPKSLLLVHLLSFGGEVIVPP